MEFNGRKGRWEKMPLNQARAINGETGLAFHIGQDGWNFFEAPGSHPPKGFKGVGAKGAHRFNAPGFDGVAFNRNTGEILLYDNKALKRGTVRDASALQKNLKKNLDNLIRKLEDEVAKDATSPPAMHAKRLLGDLKKARKAIKTGKGWPRKVGLAIGNFGGQVNKLAEGMGIKKLIDYRELKRVRKVAPVGKDLKPIIRELEKRLDKWEPEAAEKLTKKEQARVLRRVGKAVEEHAAKFAEKKLPKIITKFLLKASTKKAAKRAASLVPLVGWVFNFEDIAHGIEDVTRGHVARGLSGIGLAVGDMASDFVHIGDAVSGVGGTALSIGLQAATIAGQVSIEVERLQDKMQELNEEIQKLGALPDDGRLRDYYELDQEDIDDLKKQFAEPPDQDNPIELPGFPPDEPLSPPVDLPIQDADEDEDDMDDVPAPSPPPPPPSRKSPSKPAAPPPRPGHFEDQPIC
jgi:hypothetical protein